ncbi:hypothetical protein VYU27_004801 [Nannochloropsis oceanica]
MRLSHHHPVLVRTSGHPQLCWPSLRLEDPAGNKCCLLRTYLASISDNGQHRRNGGRDIIRQQGTSSTEGR